MTTMTQGTSIRHNRLIGMFAAVALVVSCVDATSNVRHYKKKYQLGHYAQHVPYEGRVVKTVTTGQPRSIADGFARMARLRKQKDGMNSKYNTMVDERFHGYHTGTYTTSPKSSAATTGSGTGISSNQPLLPVTEADPIIRQDPNGPKLLGGDRPAIPDIIIPSRRSPKLYKSARSSDRQPLRRRKSRTDEPVLNGDGSSITERKRRRSRSNSPAAEKQSSDEKQRAGNA